MATLAHFLFRRRTFAFRPHARRRVGCDSSQDEVTTSPFSIESEEAKKEESSEEIYPQEEGDLLMVRKLLGGQSCDLTQSQRENIFHTRCKNFDNTCSLIVGSGSCCNCCSTRLVSKLSLTITPHPKPYKL